MFLDFLVSLIYKKKNFPTIKIDKKYFGEHLALFSYKENKRLIHALKFRQDSDVAKKITNILSPILEKIYTENTIVTSIPISRRRKWIHGFNQVDPVIKNLSLSWNKENIQFKKILKRNHPRSQTQVRSRKRRIENMKEAFESTTPAKTVIILDDVITTGSTLTDAKRAALAAGAIKVYTIAFAYS